MRILLALSVGCCVLLTTHGCLDTPADSSKDRKYTYTYDKLENAWKEKDEGYMRFAIEALKDTTFSDCEAAFVYNI